MLPLRKINSGHSDGSEVEPLKRSPSQLFGSIRLLVSTDETEEYELGIDANVEEKFDESTCFDAIKRETLLRTQETSTFDKNNRTLVAPDDNVEERVKHLTAEIRRYKDEKEGLARKWNSQKTETDVLTARLASSEARRIDVERNLHIEQSRTKRLDRDLQDRIRSAHSLEVEMKRITEEFHDVVPRSDLVTMESGLSASRSDNSILKEKIGSSHELLHSL